MIRDVVAVEHQTKDGRTTGYQLRLDCGHALPVHRSEAESPPEQRRCPGCSDFNPREPVPVRHHW